ncbi:ATP-binding protein [Streptomyces purpeochromogenes]|uniref:ATP-binding protein n=1 Tax=Streptomyces TaxID=1883 RepID=UPI003AF0F241
MATLAVTAVAGAVAVVLAPSEARGWAVAVVVTAWVVLAVSLAAAHAGAGRAQRAASARADEAEQLKSSLSALDLDTAHTADVALPALIQLVRGGAKAADALGQVPLPRSPRQRKLLHIVANTIEGQEQQTAALRTDSTRVHDEMGTENARLREELHALTSEVERFTRETLPTAVSRLREGESGATVQAEVYLPEQRLLRASVEAVLRELALSERRALAAQTASAKALSRVQAKSVSMLADLRSMQERHGEEVFGDLLKLDHSTSQLGLMTDRLALLMGGRPSRAWNRPIVMESILRGAVGRIAAYQRVRLHCSSNVSIAGFAAEGVMHLLAELMDNAANFSPPIDEVHVYVEERGTGVVVTIEDSGLKMAEAAMRRADDRPGDPPGHPARPRRGGAARGQAPHQRQLPALLAGRHRRGRPAAEAPDRPGGPRQPPGPGPPRSRRLHGGDQHDGRHGPPGRSRRPGPGGPGACGPEPGRRGRVTVPRRHHRPRADAGARARPRTGRAARREPARDHAAGRVHRPGAREPRPAGRPHRASRARAVPVPLAYARPRDRLRSGPGARPDARPRIRPGPGAGTPPGAPPAARPGVGPRAGHPAARRPDRAAAVARAGRRPARVPAACGRAAGVLPPGGHSPSGGGLHPRRAARPHPRPHHGRGRAGTRPPPRRARVQRPGGPARQHAPGHPAPQRGRAVRGLPPGQAAREPAHRRRRFPGHGRAGVGGPR